MRLHVMLEPLKGKRLLPYDHQYFLMSWLYNVLRRKKGKESGRIHDMPMAKPFTFSYILSEKRRAVRAGLLCYGRTGFFFSTPDTRLGQTFSSVILHDVVEIGGSFEAVVSNVSLLDEPEFDGKAVFRSLSPLVVRRDDTDLLPTDEDFCDRLSEIVSRRYSEFTGKRSGDVSFEVAGEVKIKRHRVRDGYCKGTIFSRLIAEGDPDVILFGYQAGFGSRTGEGFGMVEVIRE